MFVEWKKVSVSDLLKGIIIQSGNDARLLYLNMLAEQKEVLLT